MVVLVSLRFARIQKKKSTWNPTRAKMNGSVQST